MDLPSLRNKSIKSQDDVLDLLKEIQYAASDDSLAGVCFQLRALLPECTGSESLVELSSLLMHSPEYYQIAVSLIHGSSTWNLSYRVHGYVTSQPQFFAATRCCMKATEWHCCGL